MARSSSYACGIPPAACTNYKLDFVKFSRSVSRRLWAASSARQNGGRARWKRGGRPSCSIRIVPCRAVPCRAAPRHATPRHATPRRVYNVLLKNRWDSKEVTRSTIGLRRVSFSLTGNMYVRSSENIRALYRLIRFCERRFQKRRLLLFSNPFSSINSDSSKSNL